MHRKKVYRSIRKHGRGIRQSVSVSVFFDEDDVHTFRTHVKKLRAFFHWLGDDKKPLTPSFKEIYHISGELRDIQVLLKSMEEKKEDIPAFTTWLRDNAGRCRQLWDDNYDPAVIRHLQESIQKPALKKPTARRLRSFFNKRVGKIESIVYLPAPADDDLHDIRKELKDMYFVYDWGKKNDCADEDDKTPETLKELGEECGQFNDKRIALTLLAAYIQQEHQPETRQAAEQLRQRWEEERLTHKTRLLEKLRDFTDSK
jgi:CHAD domain-containing protein